MDEFALPPPAQKPDRNTFATMPPARQWLFTILLSLAATVGLQLARVPAALLLGPMAGAIMVAGTGGNIRLPRPAYTFSQGLIGCMIGHSIPLAVLGEVAADWPIFFSGVLSVIAASTLLGWLLARTSLLPGTTALWGTSPGAATAMTVMAEDYGADARLVAFMQYLRVACVALAASALAMLWTGHAPPVKTDWFGAAHPAAIIATLLVATTASGIARRYRIPAGSLMLSLITTAVLSPWISLAAPLWLMAVGYTLLGWGIGLRFTRKILDYALRALPRILASIFALIAICGLFAVLLSHLTGIDLLSAYLATSPGGVDSVAIIAATTPTNMPFIMAMQSVRLVLVLALGPLLARLMARHLSRPSQE